MNRGFYDSLIAEAINQINPNSTKKTMSCMLPFYIALFVVLVLPFSSCFLASPRRDNNVLVRQQHDHDGALFVSTLPSQPQPAADGPVVVIGRSGSGSGIGRGGGKGDYDEVYYTNLAEPSTPAKITLNRYLEDRVKKDPELVDLLSLMMGLQMACKTIASLVNRAGLDFGVSRLHALSTLILRNALQFTGKCRVRTGDGENGRVLIASSLDSDYVATFDPLDGSANVDAGICTGTVFGVFNNENSVLGSAREMRVAGYCLYSSATVLMFVLDDLVQGFTLDPQLNEFVLTHYNLTMPRTGKYYSCNEANNIGWEQPVLDYLHSLKERHYALRYVGSMTGDIHRTLLHGGVFLYPSDTHTHPQGNLGYYKAAPMAVLVERAGGRSLVNATTSCLDLQPHSVHQRTPLFMGSADDMDVLAQFLNHQK
jgi:fructose-1,6-bisphosphatase I